MTTVPVEAGNEVVVRKWCEVTEQAPFIKSNGEFRDYAGSTDTCDGCAPNCANQEAPQPAGKTCGSSLSVEFTDTKERSTTGVIAGQAGGWFAGIEASLELKVGYKSKTAAKYERSVSVTIAPCTWQTEQMFLRVLEGKEMSVLVSMAPCKEIQSRLPKLLYTRIGAAQTGTISLKCNLAMNGDSFTRTIANGKCPRR